MAHSATQQSKTRLHILLIFSFFLLSLLSLSQANPVLERASYEILHNEAETKVIEDPFLSLRPHEREAILTDPVFETGRDLADFLSALVNFDDKALVEVKLVGFDDIKANELLPYLEALNTADTLHALDKKSDDIQQVRFERKTMLTVKHAPASLFESVSRVIASYATTSTVVPYDVIDQIIKADFVAGGASSNVIYIMNMPRQKLDYFYSQYEADKQHQRESCVTSMWAGKERYTWIDIRAGPLAYGPQLVGDGYVDMETLPYSNKYESLKSGKVKVDIASYVYQTHKYLLAPSLTRFPSPWTTVDIHLVMIHDHEVGGHEESEMFNWAAIQEQILSMPVLRGQKINFLKSQKSLITDDTCALIKASSLKTYANLQRTAKESKVITNHYLDSKELHHYLSVFKNQLIGESREAPGLTIPVFLFDISYKNDILLLDRVHQAVSFPDMVIAIQTQHHHVSTDYVCNGNTVHIDPRDATRPVLASLLQSIWGIAPTHQSWNRALNKGETNYLWSVSSTPFAPFSIHYNLSFAQGDAAARHMVYSKIEQLMSPLADKIEHFMDYSYELSDFLDEEEYTHFMQRWNFLQFKTSEVKKYLTLNLFNASLAFVESAQFDVDALSNHLAEVHGRVHSFIKCGETTVDYVSLSSVVVTVIMGVIVATLLIRKLSSKLRRAKKVKNY